MSLLGSLSVNLVANTRQFTDKLKKAKTEVSTFSKQLGNLTVMGLGAATTAATAFVRAELQLIDALSKSSRQLGISTEELGAYHHAAELSGIATDRLETALSRMQDTVGAALLGEKGAVRAFEALGLSAQQVADAEDPLSLIQKHLSAIGDQNTRVALIRDIFGRGGVEMLNFFEQDLGKIVQHYKDLGAAVSDKDAQKIEQLNDSMLELSTKFKGIGRRILVDASDRLIASVEGLEKIVDFWMFKPSPDRDPRQKVIDEMVFNRGMQFMHPFGGGLMGLLGMYNDQMNMQQMRGNYAPAQNTNTGTGGI